MRGFIIVGALLLATPAHAVCTTPENTVCATPALDVPHGVCTTPGPCTLEQEALDIRAALANGTARHKCRAVRFYPGSNRYQVVCHPYILQEK